MLCGFKEKLRNFYVLYFLHMFSDIDIHTSSFVKKFMLHHNSLIQSFYKTFPFIGYIEIVELSQKVMCTLYNSSFERQSSLFIMKNI